MPGRGSWHHPPDKHVGSIRGGIFYIEPVQWPIQSHIPTFHQPTFGGNGWLANDDGSWWWFQTHCSESRAHLKRVSPCPLLWWLVAQTAVSLLFSSPALVPCLLDFLANACTITYLTGWKERDTIRFISELVHNLASALALRAPLSYHQPSLEQPPTSRCLLPHPGFLPPTTHAHVNHNVFSLPFNFN